MTPAIKQRFKEKYGHLPPPPSSSAGRGYALDKIRKMSPAVYSADDIMKLSSREVRCDHFVFCAFPAVSGIAAAGIYVVEVKQGKPRGGKKHSGVSKQLRAGAKFVESHLRPGECFRFLPVLVARGISGSFRRKLLKTTITLRDDERQIKYISLGDSLPVIPPVPKKPAGGKKKRQRAE